MKLSCSGITMAAQLSINGGAHWPGGYLAAAAFFNTGAVAAGFRLRSVQRGLKSYKRKVSFISSKSTAVPPVGRKPFLLVRMGMSRSKT